MDSSFSKSLLLYFFLFFKPQTQAYSDIAHPWPPGSSCISGQTQELYHQQSHFESLLGSSPFCPVTVSSHSGGFLCKLFFSIKGMAGVSQSVKPKPVIQNSKEASRTGPECRVQMPGLKVLRRSPVFESEPWHTVRNVKVPQGSHLPILAESVLSFQITESFWICGVCLEGPENRDACEALQKHTQKQAVAYSRPQSRNRSGVPKSRVLSANVHLRTPQLALGNLPQHFKVGIRGSLQAVFGGINVFTTWAQSEDPAEWRHPCPHVCADVSVYQHLCHQGLLQASKQKNSVSHITPNRVQIQ